MFNVISTSNLENIKNAANQLLAFIKTKKIFLCHDFCPDNRVKASSLLIDLYRTFKDEDAYYNLKTENQDDLVTLKSLTFQLSNLVLNKTDFMSAKLKDYGLDIKPKLCRELITHLEDLFIFGEITRVDINEVYKTLSKSVPKKFLEEELIEESHEFHASLRSSLKEHSEDIKANSIRHYTKIINRIDPEDTIVDKKEFIRMARKIVGNMNTLRLCMAYKFRNNEFHDLINYEFDMLLNTATNRIYNECNYKEKNPKIKIHNIKLGAKGFDIRISVNDQYFNARAITAEGEYVRFHYRYIVT